MLWLRSFANCFITEQFVRHFIGEKSVQKIAGRKRPALVDPVHKVKRGNASLRCLVKFYFIKTSERSVPCIWNLPFGRVCSATSRVDFRLSECVLPRPGSIFGQQSVFRHIPGLFSVSRVSSAMSRVNFQSARFVPPHHGSISGR